LNSGHPKILEEKDDQGEKIFNEETHFIEETPKNIKKKFTFLNSNLKKKNNLNSINLKKENYNNQLIEEQNITIEEKFSLINKHFKNLEERITLIYQNSEKIKEELEQYSDKDLLSIKQTIDILSDIPSIYKDCEIDLAVIDNPSENLKDKFILIDQTFKNLDKKFILIE
jgi:hypothetical protein